MPAKLECSARAMRRVMHLHFTAFGGSLCGTLIRVPMTNGSSSFKRCACKTSICCYLPSGSTMRGRCASTAAARTLMPAYASFRRRLNGPLSARFRLSAALSVHCCFSEVSCRRPVVNEASADQVDAKPPFWKSSMHKLQQALDWMTTNDEGSGYCHKEPDAFSKLKKATDDRRC